MKKIIGYIEKHVVAILIIFLIWLAIVVFGVAPLALATADTAAKGGAVVELMEGFVENLVTFDSFFKVFNASNGASVFIKQIGLFTIFYIGCVIYGIYKNSKKEEYKDIEHGSSDWSSKGEQYTILSKDSGIILAEGNRLPVTKDGNINVLVVAGSGAGKTASFAKPNAHELLGSYVFTDPKGEIFDDSAGYLKANGYDIKVLNLVNPDASDSYNPLTHIKSEIDVDIIASTIVKGQKTEGGAQDPYWDNMAELLLKSLIYYLLAARPPEEQNLASCAELVRAANSNGDSNLLSDLIGKLPYDHPARMNFKSVELASDKTYSSILSTLQSKLGKFDSKEIADVTSTNTINFEDIAKKPTALYVITSDTHGAYDFLSTIFFAQMIQQLYDFADKNGGALPIRTFFILDEFANIGQIPDFDKKISTSRSRHISFSVILQNLDQLKAIYERSYETIIGNCDTHLFLGSNSYATVEYFSKELGEKTISHKSKSTTKDKGTQKKTSVSESDQIMARPLMTPDELRRMDTNECIIFEKGVKPIKAKKYWYYEHKNIVKDFETNRILHNDYKIENRGEWRKFNPYNPDASVRVTEQTPEIKMESLDDLFEEATDNKESTEKKETLSQEVQVPKTSSSAPAPAKEEAKPAKAPVYDEEELDIEKELEAKFDELFGRDS